VPCQPIIRRDGERVPVVWDEAIVYVAAGFWRIVEEYGPDAVAFYGKRLTYKNTRGSKSLRRK